MKPLPQNDQDVTLVLEFASQSKTDDPKTDELPEDNVPTELPPPVLDGQKDEHWKLVCSCSSRLSAGRRLDSGMFCMHLRRSWPTALSSM